MLLSAECTKPMGLAVTGARPWMGHVPTTCQRTTGMGAYAFAVDSANDVIGNTTGAVRPLGLGGSSG